MSQQKIIIFDTTLRDGQQSPGAGMSFDDNIRYAELASKLQIDVLEAGFPAASQRDADIVNAICQQVVAQSSTMKIAALCQLREDQFATTMQSLIAANQIGQARLHTYLPVDPNLIQASLGGKSYDKAFWIKEVYRLIKMATDQGFEVEFSPEGYSRMGENWLFVTATIEAAIEAGATIINCPDTIGGASRYQGNQYFVNLMQRHADYFETRFPDKDITWSCHCHNDLGMAVENSMAAIFEGPARQIEGCMNGVGERAGNAAIEQCMMLIDQFGQRPSGQVFYTDCQLAHLKSASDFIADRMLPRQPHTPIVGDNAARHSSGGHTNAILRDPMSYQPFDPKRVGSEIDIVFGPLSGGNHAKRIIEQHGEICHDNEKADIAQFIKNQYVDRRKGITDQEVMAGYFAYRQQQLREGTHG